MPRLRALLVVLALHGLAAGAAAGPTTRTAEQQAARRKLVERTYTPAEARPRIRFVPPVYSSRAEEKPGTHGYPVPLVSRSGGPEEDAAHWKGPYHESLSRLIDLDAAHNLLSPREWDRVRALYAGGQHPVTNAHEGIAFELHDPDIALRQTRALAEKARGKLAAILVGALRGKPNDPATLGQTLKALAKKYPVFANAFHAELLIADAKGIAPALARWDFTAQGAPRATLPAKIQRTVSDLGRSYANANVLIADHLYTDAHVMIDAMIAMGLRPENARFVTTPYPFDEKVRAGVEARGIPVAHAPYDQTQTRAHVEKALAELVAKARVNRNPILVIDDGGMAAKVIAEKHADELHLFRVVEITKAGERVAKQALPGVLHDKRALLTAMSTLTREQQRAMKERYLAARGSDAATRAEAEESWAIMSEWARRNRGEARPVPLPAHLAGFAHYTYSDSRYKREVMTPLYTQAVNRATFEALAHGGIQLTNKRVTIIGGGAMGLNAGIELRDKDFEVTFVEPDATRRKVIEIEHGFSTGDLEPSLGGRGLVLEMSGMHKLLRSEHLFLLDDNTTVAHGSSKDNPFDMASFKALAEEVVPWKPSPTGQASASYVFSAAGQKRTLHFPGDGYTISHGGKDQNVPLKKFLPEIDALLRLGAHALHEQTVTHFPFFGTPEWLLKPGEQRKRLRGDLHLPTMDLTPRQTR